MGGGGVKSKVIYMYYIILEAMCLILVFLFLSVSSHSLLYHTMYWKTILIRVSLEPLYMDDSKV